MFSTRLELIYPVTLGIANLIIPEYILVENAETVLINPLSPQSWGIIKAGGHPQTPGRNHPATLSQQSLTLKLLLGGLFQALFLSMPLTHPGPGTDA